jgi:hypothetical protein
MVMKGKGMALNSTNDCFAQFDEAFARLEADLATPDERSSTPSADLSEYEEAFDNIDRQLAAQPEPTTPETPTSEPMPAPAPAVTPEPLADGVIKPTRVNLALVPPTAVAESSRTTALVQHETETLWERPANGGTPLERLVGTMQNLLWLQRAIHARSPRIVDRVRWQQVADVFNDVRQLCTEFDLQTARVRAEFALKALDDDRLDGLAAEIGELVRHIRHDLQTCSIVPIARESVWGFTLALDARAQRAFPSAVREVADAGRCIGFTTHAAAAFHLMRAAEIGRRAVARAIRFDTRETEAADWAGTITALQARMLDLSGWPAGPARKAVKNFLTALLSDAREMEEARRRLAEGEPFMECHAVALWYSTRDFLALAAERVSETEDTLLTADDFVGSEVTGNG